MIDGRRLYGNYVGEVNDRLGLFELFIHILLYNLRLSGIKNGSTVLIIMGNHEILSLHEYKISDYINNYVHRTSYKLFNTYKIRSDTLIPFYLFNPRVFQIIETDNKKIITLSHGSFSSLDGGFTGGLNIENLYKFDKATCDLFENLFIQGNNFTSYSNENMKDLDTMTADNTASYIYNILWSRYFPDKLKSGKSELSEQSTLKESGCFDLTTDPVYSNVSSIIMGHCPNNNLYKTKRFTNTNKEYNLSDCGNGGCLFVGCMQKNTPSLIIVDCLLSSANNINTHTVRTTHRISETRESTTYQYKCLQEPDTSSCGKTAEILLIVHSPKKNKDFDFYRISTNFNKSTRIYYMIDTLNSIGHIVPKSIASVDIFNENKYLINKHNHQHIINFTNI